MDYIKRIKKIKSEMKITNDELAEKTGHVSGRSAHAITPLIVLTRYLSAAS